MTTDPERVAAARRWFRTLGQAPIRDGGLTLVATPAHPDTWELNGAAVTPGADPAAALTALDRHFAHTPWRVVHTDALDAPEVEAALTLAGFTVAGTTVELIAHDSLGTADTDTVRVDESNWPAFAALVVEDHAEGLRTGDTSPAVGAGLLAAMRARLALCDHRLIRVEGEHIGYGMTVACPGGLGLIEHLFTRPGARGRGIMSAFIRDADRRLREAGCYATFIDAHAGAPPARLYASLGFAPAALARTWVRKSPE